MSKVEKNDDDNRGWECRSSRFSVDALLRENGWKIAERKMGKEAIWEKGDLLYPFREAIRCLKKGALKDAEYAEELYYDGFD